MFKAIRVTILLLILLFVAVSTWLTQARSTDWNNTLYVKVYPINGDGSQAAAKYIDRLDVESFAGIERFVAREVERYGVTIDNPVKMELGQPIDEQPPSLEGVDSALGIMWWSLKMRLWAGDATDNQPGAEPDAKIFVRYHSPDTEFALENSVGLQKGMVGIVNAFASRRLAGSNNVIIAHEFLHTLGATDKYELGSGQPHYPHGYGEPEKNPRHPQRFAEIMGGRIAQSETRALIPSSLKSVVVGRLTAQEIQLIDD